MNRLAETTLNRKRTENRYVKLTRRKMVFAALATAAFLATGSVAYACLTQKGDLLLDPASGTTGSLVIGNQVGHGWCSWPTVAATAAQSESVNVAVSPAQCGVDSGQLPTDTYQIRIQHDNNNPQWAWSGTNWQFRADTGCFRTGVTATTLTSSFSVTSGSGNMNVTVPSGASDSDANEAAGICVGLPSNSGTAGAGLGIFGPLDIT